ncbi:MAG: hypothetical protein WA955_15725 [Diaphorobacter nitroreducens]|uniref:hypothetical protein n=1 Tax=Diaphorobacter nitroreducens TaxID=164759 RepID=UPI003C72E304
MNDSAEKTKRPAFQFYPADWRKDVELQSCSMAAQGLWINAMCVAHECEPYGHLMVNGKPMTCAQLGRQVGLSQKETETLVTELLDAGVAKKGADGALFSKRMVQDEATRNARASGGKEGAAHGAKGGSHGNKGGRPAKPKGGFETPLPGFEEPPPSSSSSSSPSGDLGANAPSSKARLPTCPKQAIVDLYHEVLPELPGVRVMDAAREKAITTFWQWVLTTTKPDGSPRATTADEALVWARDYFHRARSNDFIMGRGVRSAEHVNWRCTIEYLLSSRGMKKVIEETQEVVA